MDTKERWTKYNESLQKEPIDMIDGETFQIGGSFFWRQLLLGAPAYAIGLWANLGRGFQRMPDVLAGLIVVVLIPSVFYALGGAETWRSTGRIPALSVDVLKQGLSLWWRILTGWIRFVIPLFVLALLAAWMRIDDDVIEVLSVLLWALLSVPIMGLAVRQWRRMKAILAGTWTPDAPPVEPASSANPFV